MTEGSEADAINALRNAKRKTSAKLYRDAITQARDAGMTTEAIVSELGDVSVPEVAKLAGEQPPS